MLFLACGSALATHIVGGEISYEDLGEGNYRVRLVVYRDCGPANQNGTGFDDQASVGIFNGNGALVNVLNIPLAFQNVSNVPVALENPCGTPSPFCVCGASGVRAGCFHRGICQWVYPELPALLPQPVDCELDQPRRCRGNFYHPNSGDSVDRSPQQQSCV